MRPVQLLVFAITLAICLTIFDVIRGRDFDPVRAIISAAVLSLGVLLGMWIKARRARRAAA